MASVVAAGPAAVQCCPAPSSLTGFLPMAQGMGPFQLSAANRTQAVRLAVVGNVVPIAIAVATRFSSHHALFFLGAVAGCIAPIIVTAVPRRYRVVYALAALGGIPALTLMQSYSGGVSSGYSILLVMAMIWFGLQATDRELLAGAAILVACAYLPMLMLGPPAFPVDWGAATLLVLISSSVALTLRTLAREMQRLTRQLRNEAVIDDLTGLLNRRGWRRMAVSELERAGRSSRPIALVTIDLDHFKQLNDAFGHERGDRALRETAARLQATFRAGDIVARIGGDEFVALLTNSTLEGALGAIERMRDGTAEQAGISAGIAIWDGEEDLRGLMHRADRALYDAKSEGGGRTHVARPTLLPLTAASAVAS